MRKHKDPIRQQIFPFSEQEPPKNKWIDILFQKVIIGDLFYVKICSETLRYLNYLSTKGNFQ